MRLLNLFLLSGLQPTQAAIVTAVVVAAVRTDAFDVTALNAFHGASLSNHMTHMQSPSPHLLLLENSQGAPMHGDNKVLQHSTFSCK